MARVKRSVNGQEAPPRDPRAGRGVLRRASRALPQGQRAGHALAAVRVPRPPGPQGRVPAALDRAHQRRVPRARHLVLALHRGPEGRRDRRRPQVLADLAVRDAAAFGALVTTAREALEAASRAPAPLGPRHRRVKRLRVAHPRPEPRRAEGAFVIEGPRLLDAALDHGVPARGVLPRTRRRARRSRRSSRGCAPPVCPSCELKEGVLERIGDTRDAAAGPRGRAHPGGIARRAVRQRARPGASGRGRGRRAGSRATPARSCAARRRPGPRG